MSLYYEPERDPPDWRRIGRMISIMALGAMVVYFVILSIHLSHAALPPPNAPVDEEWIVAMTVEDAPEAFGNIVFFYTDSPQDAAAKRPHTFKSDTECKKFAGSDPGVFMTIAKFRAMMAQQLPPEAKLRIACIARPHDLEHAT